MAMDNDVIEKSDQRDKFADPVRTASGEKRARVDFTDLETLWFNTGTLCNLACANCYIESSPRNDRLVYLSYDEVRSYLDEIDALGFNTCEIGITGGEPFMNPDIIPIMEESLKRGYRLLMLTNAMRPMMKKGDDLLRLHETYGDQLTMRVSVDHYSRELHEEERGPGAWEPMMKGLKWLSDNSFYIDIAGRTRWGEDENALRAGYQDFFDTHGIALDAQDKTRIVLFPEMDENAPVPEITTGCWEKTGVNPDDIMCASSRMVVKRKGDTKPSVQACTLIPYDQEFNMGSSLYEASTSVQLNHPHCSKFCVLGGGSCGGK